MYIKEVPRLTDRQLERIESHIHRDDGCWRWDGYHNQGGYAVTSVAGTHYQAIRVVYQAFTGTVLPTSLVLDHTCRNRWCVNPAHLEPVTHRINYLRGVGGPAQNARKTHCHRGHPLSGSNLLVRADGRQCRSCAKVRMAAYLERQQLEAA